MATHMMADSLSSTFTGVVRCVNPKGLKLEGHDEWANVSKYAVGVVLPEKGQTVTITLDKAGFLRACEVLPYGLPGPAPIRGASDAVPPAQSRSGPSDKDRTITRLAVLKAAADFAATRHDLKSGEVLRIAESWERWILRPADDLDVTDAF